MNVAVGRIAAAISISVVLISIAVFFVSEQEKPHVLWVSNGLTIGENLQLFESGEYTSEPWCDICERKKFRGTWKNSNGVLTLEPKDSGRKVRRLLIIEKYGCRYMHDMAYPRPPEDISPSRISPSDFTNKDDCLDKLMENDFRELQLR